MTRQGKLFCTLHRIACGLVAIVALSLAGRTPALAQATQWSMGTSSSGSGPYVNGTIIAKAVNQAQSAVTLSAQTSGGYNENLALVAMGHMQVGLGIASDLYDAYSLRNKFANISNNESFKNLRLMFTFGLTPCHYVVRADSKFHKFEDLKGAKFNINTPATFTRSLNMEVIKAFGMKPTDFQLGGVSTGQFFKAMQDRIIEAGGHCFQIGLGALQEMAASSPIRLIDIPDDVFKRLNDRYEGLLLSLTIPANTYPGQTTPNRTFALNSVLYTNASTNADQVYAVTKAFWSTLQKFQGQSQDFTGLTPDMAVSVSNVPLHPGAERYFREAGILK